MEVSELLSQAVLDTSDIASRSSTPKRPGSLALATPLPLKKEDSAKLVDTSSKVTAPQEHGDGQSHIGGDTCLSAPFGETLGPVGNLPP